MPPKKKGEKKKKKKAEKKVAPPDPAKVKAEKQAVDAAAKERAEAVASVAWVHVARTWVQQERSQIFDQCRIHDSDSDGKLTPEEAMLALLSLHPPLQRDETEALVACLDRDGKIAYATPPTTLKCYGGGLQEMVSRSLDRVMAIHAQDLAEIEERCKAAVAAIYSGGGPGSSGGGGGGDGGDTGCWAEPRRTDTHAAHARAHAEQAGGQRAAQGVAGSAGGCQQGRGGGDVRRRRCERRGGIGRRRGGQGAVRCLRERGGGKAGGQ